MLSTKLRALDSDESDDSDSGSTSAVTKEALEQRALSQYQEALQLERDGKWKDSEDILKELLSSDVLAEVEGKVVGSSKSSFTHLKYCVTMNLGHCLVKQNKIEEGLEYYLKATELDDTDINLWFKIGRVAMDVPDLNIAMTAFEEGLRCSPNHWGCLDSLVTVSYALRDFLACLVYISKGLLMDIGFVKGHAFKLKIFSRTPSLKTDFHLFHPGCELPDVGSIVLDEALLDKFYAEAESLNERYYQRLRPKTPPPVAPLVSDQPLTNLAWVSLANHLLKLHDLAIAQYPDQPVFRPAVIKVSLETEEKMELDEPEESSSAPSEQGAADDKQGEDSDQVDKSGGGYERWISSQKRRSARVRSTVKREEPSLARALTKLIPTNLLPHDEKKDLVFEDSMHTMDLYRLFETKEADENKGGKKNVFSEADKAKIIEEDGYFGTTMERLAVQSFLLENENTTVVDYIHALVNKLSFLWDSLWPEPLVKLYLKAFQVYMMYNPAAIIESPIRRTNEDDMSILLFGELLLDNWIDKGKRKGVPSPLGKSLLGGTFPSLYLGRLENRSHLCKSVEIISRIFWLESMLFYHTGNIESTTIPLEYMLNEEWFKNVEVTLPNVRNHYLINNEVVFNTLKSLRRNKNLGEVWDLYNSGNYEEVTDILSDSLSADQNRDDDIVPRPMQFAIILESYWKLSKFRESLKWAEFYLFETLTQYRNASDEEDRANYGVAIINTLQGIMSLINTVGTIIFRTLSSDKLIRFVQTLCNIIYIQMEPTDSTEMPIESVSPWIILHYIIKDDEDAKVKRGEPIIFNTTEEEEAIPTSLAILYQAHEYLGRRGWCCFNEGSLLYHTLEVIYPSLMEINPESQAMVTLNQQIDQIFYCLYGQQKKTKGRHILDHNAYSLALTWNRAQQIFIFTKPRELPSYDSTGKCAITADTESLYLKIIALVPPACDPARLIPDMTKYIEGETEEVPKNNCPLPQEVNDIYYLLAHFYFRNKSWNKVLKYYLLDVCANPNRVDSWACLALARGSLIETKINSCESIKNESELLKSAEMVTRCYERSLRLDPCQSTLWIEKGSFSYMLHSFCSNLLKKDLNLSIEMFEVLEKKKETMLSSALEAFTTANKIWYSCKGQDIQDERWLHQYMMGKISEKREEPPEVYIGHYLQASELLSEMCTGYPKVISHAAPQFLSVESLEMYYRIHASVLKAVEKSEGKPMTKASLVIFKDALKKLSQSKFFLSQKHPSNVSKSKPSSEAVKTEPMETNSDLAETKSALLEVKTEIDSKDLSLAESIDNDVKSTLEDLLNKVSACCKVSRTASSESDPTTSDTVSKSSSKVPKSDSSSDSSSSSSSDSSGESSSSSDDSSSSSDSEDSETTQQVKKPKLEIEDETVDWENESEWLIVKCLEALELCTKRFQEHFKSLYHLAYFYFKNKKHKHLDKVKQLLLDQGGLFYERKPSNFFNGIWRIPNNEIDRPGSFAAHMGRCVHLLLDYLMEVKDYKMLVDLALHLKIAPEPDKKYLRDNEREELFREALSLSAQVLRKKLLEISGESLKSFIMDVYFIHKKVSKSSLKEPMFGIVLSDAYSKLANIKPENNVEAAIKYCKQVRASERAAASANFGGPPPSIASIPPASAASSSSAPILLPSAVVTPSVPPGITIVTASSSAAASSVSIISSSASAPIPSISIQPTQSSVPTFIPNITKTSISDDLDSIMIGGLSSKGRGSSNRGVGKRPRGRPPLSQTRARHTMPSMHEAAVSLMQQCTTLLQQNPEWCRQIMAMAGTSAGGGAPMVQPPQIPPQPPPPQAAAPLPAPLASAKELGLSITPVTLSSSSKGGPQSPVLSRSQQPPPLQPPPPRPPLSLPCSISITSVPPKQTFPSSQSISITPAPKNFQDQKLSSPKTFPDPKLSSPKTFPDPKLSSPKTFPDPKLTSPKTFPDPKLTSPKAFPDLKITAPKTFPDPKLTAPKTFLDPKLSAPPPLPPAKSELSLQHKILSAKKGGPRSSGPSRAQPPSTSILLVPPVSRPMGQAPRPRLPAPRPRDPNRPIARRSSNLMRPQFPPEILNQLSITPAAPKRGESSYTAKNPPRPSAAPSSSLKIPNLDSTVAQAIMNFGTSITITPAPKPQKPVEPEISVTPAKPQPSTSSNPSSQPPPGNNLSVIVLDD